MVERPSPRRGPKTGPGPLGAGEPFQSARKDLQTERDVLVARVLVRRVACAAVEAPDEEHSGFHARAAERGCIVPRPGRELDDGGAVALDLLAQNSPDALGHLHRSDPIVRIVEP